MKHSELNVMLKFDKLWVKMEEINFVIFDKSGMTKFWGFKSVWSKILSLDSYL